MRKILLFLTTTVVFSLLAGTTFAQNSKEQSFVTTDMAIKIGDFCQNDQEMLWIFVKANLTEYNRESDRILRTLDSHLEYAERFLLSLYNRYGLENGYFALKKMGFTIQETDIIESVWKNQPNKLKQQAEAEKEWEENHTKSVTLGNNKEYEQQRQEELYRQPTFRPNVGSGGNGTNFNLAGRSLATTPPKPEYNSKSEGKVVVEIRVDRNGNVISASAGKAGTTTNDPILRETAKNAALKAKFNSDPNAPEVQVGTITYTFVQQ